MSFLNWCSKQPINTISIFAVIINIIISSLMIEFNASSETYCKTTYSDISASGFTCLGDLESCNGDTRCYIPSSTFGFEYCKDRGSGFHCECCQAQIIHDLSIPCIVFLVFTGLLTCCLVQQFNAHQNDRDESVCILFLRICFLFITNVGYLVISILALSNEAIMDSDTFPGWIFWLSVSYNAMSLLYIIRRVFRKKKGNSKATENNTTTTNPVFNNRQIYGMNVNVTPIQPQPTAVPTASVHASAPPPAYDEAPPAYNHNDAPPSYNDAMEDKAPGADSKQDIRAWFKDTINLPSDDFTDYNEKYCSILIENGFDTFKGIATISDGDLIAMGIDKLGHRKQIMLAINQLEPGQPGQGENNEGHKVTLM